MKAFVNGAETELDPNAFDVVPFGDRLMVRTSLGTFSAVAIRQGDAVFVSYKGLQYRVEDRKSRSGASSQTAGSGELRAPMPGQIVDVRKQAGDSVKKGEVIVVLEAMKTQQPFSAPFDGKVDKLAVAKGDQVADGAVLAVVVPEEKAGE